MYNKILIILITTSILLLIFINVYCFIVGSWFIIIIVSKVINKTIFVYQLMDKNSLS